MNILIRKMSRDTLGDFLSFFDETAFADNPEWRHCYCVFFHHAGDAGEWNSRSGEQNRGLAIELIASGVLSGFLAYDGSVPVGWCNANDKQSYSFDKNRKEVYTEEDGDIVSIVCFVISHLYRRRGVSTALLKDVIDWYAQSGKRYLEAYPVKTGRGDSENYHGPLSLYLKNGFHVEKEHDGYSVVRYRIGEQSRTPR